MTDLETLTKTVYGEARGESALGRLAVAFVARNRAAIAARYVAAHPTKSHHPLYGDGTVASACLMPYQFSCWLPHDPNFPKLLGLDVNSEEAHPCLEAAQSAIAGTAPDASEGATHYHTAGVHPSWAYGQTPVTVIGQHLFYRLG